MKGSGEIGRVLGHGSARSGAHHWWMQRVTAIALLPLTVWFVWSLLLLPGFDHSSVTAWIGGSWSAVLLCLLVLSACWHSSLGVQVVIEDYVHSQGVKVLCLLAVNFAHVLMAAVGVFAVLKIALGAA